jgi:GNAT superfamily N-acetyltransferase
VIRQINDNFDNSISIIRRSFITVTYDLGITKENCPTHTAFIKELEQGPDIFHFGVFTDENKQIGFFSIIRKTDEVYDLEKVAVIPEYRHQQHGKSILIYADEFVKNRKGRRIKISLIAENTVLADWYRKNGYVDISTKKFDHFPFTVLYMEKIFDKT